MRTNRLNLITKLRAIEMVETTNNVKATAREFKVWPSQIRKWRLAKDEIERQAAESPRKLTLHKGRRPEYEDLEESVYEWIMEQRADELAVSTTDVIEKAVALLPNFKGNNENRRIYWVYDFLKRRNLSVRTRTRVSQITNAAMQPVKDEYCRRVMTTFDNRINHPKYLINMDETAVYLNCTPKKTVHPQGERTVAVLIGGSSSMRFTLAVTVAMDGTKLPLFVIFKGVPGGKVDQSLESILPTGVLGCVQPKAWMDNRTMEIWYTNVFRPFIAGYQGNTGLLLDDFKCHKSNNVTQLMDADNAVPFMIPPHYTGLLQPCDVGINKALRID